MLKLKLKKHQKSAMVFEKMSFISEFIITLLQNE